MSSLTQESQSFNAAGSKKLCYTIEGNIGCGKSTFLQILKERIPEVHIIEEPVSQWQSVNGKNINILEKYYKKPNRWGFTFQIYAIFTRIKALQQVSQRYPHKIIICERSILADLHVFSELMKDLGYMDESEYYVFKSLYENFEQMAKKHKMKVIYLKCNPEKCYQRTKLRKREEEEQIAMQYLELIHGKHEKWMKNQGEENMLTIDTTDDFKGSEDKIQEMLSALTSFLGV